MIYGAKTQMIALTTPQAAVHHRFRVGPGFRKPGAAFKRPARPRRAGSACCCSTKRPGLRVLQQPTPAKTRTNWRSFVALAQRDGLSGAALWEPPPAPGYCHCGGNLAVPCHHDLRVFKRMALACPPSTVEAQTPRSRCSHPAPKSVWNHHQHSCRTAISCDVWECKCSSRQRTWSKGVRWRWPER